MINYQKTFAKTCLVSFFLVIIGCNPTTEITAPLWIPTNSVENKTQEEYMGVRAIPSTLISSLLFAVQPEKLMELSVPNLKQHPLEGPFVFEGDNSITIVAEQPLNRVNLEKICRYSEKPVTRYYGLNGTNWPNSISIDKEYESVPSCQIKVNNSLGDNRIKLTPENLADALSKFSQWEGIHLDEDENILNIVGTDEKSSPQISVSDLVTAYNAIFVHEAAGEPLFVDMDFSGNDKDYTVTFGGGFEDTRPGRVLLSADILLKALSSGIDPWTKVSPLVDEMCSEQTDGMQKLYCQYIKGSKKHELSQIANNISKEMTLRKEKTNTILKAVSVEGEADCVEYLFSADSYIQNVIIKDINIDSVFYQDEYRSCFFQDETTGRKDKNGLLEHATEIFSLESYEKDIAITCFEKYQDINHRAIYALLSLGAKDIKYFLDNNPKSRANIFEIYQDVFSYEIKILMGALFYEELKKDKRKLEQFKRESPFEAFLMDLMYDEDTGISFREFKGMYLFTYLLSKDKDFLQNFLLLNKKDQLTFTYIATAALADPSYIELIDKLQYYHPLCNSEVYDSSEDIDNFEDAFMRFTCSHLSKFKRTYLADLIRKETNIEYKTASEIRASYNQDGYFDKDSIKQTRFWFYPGNKVVTLNESDCGTFLFNKPNMVAKAEPLSDVGDRRGPYEAVYLPEDRIFGIHDNLDIVNENYDALSEIFPTLKELNNLVKTLAFFRWIRDMKSEQFDLSAFENAHDSGTPTPRKYPVYETVIALQDGGMVRALGGVDLHSETQIELKDLSNLKDKISSNKNTNSTVNFGSRNFKIATIQNESVENLVDKNTVAQHTKTNVKINYEPTLNGEFITCVDGNSEGSFILSNSNIFDKNQLIINEKVSGDEHKYAIYNDHKLSEIWNIETKSNQVVAKRGNETDTHSILEFTQNTTQYFMQQGVPDEILWKFISSFSKHAKMKKVNDNYIYQLNINGTDYDLLGRVDATTEEYSCEIVNPVDIDNSSYRGNSSSFKISFQSNVPIDSLYISDIGVIDDFDFDINVFGENGKIHTSSVTNGEIEFPMPLKVKNTKRPIIQLYSTEFQKGKYLSYEILNRPTLIHIVSSWQKEMVEKGNSILLNSTPSNDVKVVDAIDVPKNRIFAVDLTGFSPENISWFNQLKQQFPEKILIVSNDEADVKLKNADEIVWVTTLNEKEATARLQLMSQRKNFESVKRLRVFNVNNPIYDLGQNIFVENESLQLVGAWSNIVDLSTLKPLLELLLKQGANEELNQGLHTFTKTLELDYRQNPTPLKLRIARYLPETLMFWEEVAASHNTWVIK